MYVYTYLKCHDEIDFFFVTYRSVYYLKILVATEAMVF